MKTVIMQLSYSNNLDEMNEKIDDDFVNVLHSKISNLDKDVKLKYRKVINFDNLLYIGEYIDNLKPKSKYRNYKHQIINFLNIINKNQHLNKKEIVAYVQEYLVDTFSYLQKKHSFVDKFSWFWRSAFSLIFDLILILSGVARYYYYIPIFTILSLSKNLYKLKRAKKEGRFIDF